MTEFKSFLVEGILPPPELDSRVSERVTKKLHPSLFQSVAKLFACNAVGSILTLFLCPQYGLSITGASFVMPWLMDIHPAFCFFVCGMLWMLAGQFLANFILSWDEQLVLSRYYFGTAFSFVLFSVLAFACLGSLTFDGWLIAWGLGALAVIAAFSTKISVRVRRVRRMAGIVTGASFSQR